MNNNESPIELAEQLRESEARYRRFIQFTADAIWCLEPPESIGPDVPPRECARIMLEDATFTEANKTFCRRHGIESAVGLRATELSKFWLSGEPARAMTLAQKRFSSQEVVVKEVDGQGRIQHLACGLYGIEDERGLKSVWAIERDVTSRVEEEKLLRQSQEFYKAISETALDGICVLDGDLALIDCNDAFAQLVGAPRETLVESGRVLLQPVLGIKEEPVPFSSIAHHGRWRGEALLNRIVPRASVKTEPLRVELACRVTDVGHSKRFYCFVRDLSERHSAEKRESEHQRALAHVARLSTLGEMTSGIAHELNQPLAAIVNYANGCTRILGAQGIDEPMVARGLSAIAEQGRRAADIIRRMRSFSRRESDKREPFRISDVLSEAVELSIADLHKAGIRIETDFGPMEDVVLVDGIQIEQVTLNLIRNAVDALTASKLAAVAAQTGTEGSPQVDISSPQKPSALSLPPQITVMTRGGGANDEGSFSHVTVSIEDNGPGIPDSVSARLFDPFFSRGGHGIGLGLTISRSIVESHGGRLWYSPGEVGASFHFTLPLRSAPILE